MLSKICKELGIKHYGFGDTTIELKNKSKMFMVGNKQFLPIFKEFKDRGLISIEQYGKILRRFRGEEI